jgi:hypothetical protein
MCTVAFVGGPPNSADWTDHKRERGRVRARPSEVRIILILIILPVFLYTYYYFRPIDFLFGVAGSTQTLEPGHHKVSASIQHNAAW